MYYVRWRRQSFEFVGHVLDAEGNQRYATSELRKLKAPKTEDAIVKGKKYL